MVSEEQDVTLSAENVLRLRQKETSFKLSEDIILSGESLDYSSRKNGIVDPV